MKMLILLAFVANVFMANAFAGALQESYCGTKSAKSCLNHFHKQCEAKNYRACYVVGELNYGYEIYSEAKKYYEMVCENANIKDSYEMDSAGAKVPTTVKAMQLSCWGVGELYRDYGEGITQSYEKALQYFQKACDLGGAYGCAGAGELYYEGQGTKKDLNYAVKLYTKSCELDHMRGCISLGEIYESGIGVKQNLSKAKELYKKVCDFGYQDTCDKYKELKEMGY